MADTDWTAANAVTPREEQAVQPATERHDISRRESQAGRSGPRQVMRQLHEKPYEFGFYRAMRLLECEHPDKPRLGRSQRLADDPVRLGQEPSLAFAPSTLAEFLPGEPSRLTARFFGLFGPNGPLPLHLTEFARDRLRNSNDPTLVRFVNLFHHRLMCLFYRVWAEAEPAVSFDRPGVDRFSDYVASLFGLGLPSLRNRDALPDLAKLAFAGRLSCQTRPPEGLRAILAGTLRLPVTLREFVGHWMAIPEDCRWRLGGNRSTGTLGESATIGSRVWDCQSKFRIIIGPLKLEDYRRLLPGGVALERARAAVRNYIGYELDWDVRLILRRDEVPTMQLGVQGQLGWTTWLLAAPASRDADDLTLVPETLASRSA